MDRRPRDPKSPLVPPRAFAFALLQGLAILLTVFGVYWHQMSQGQDLATARGFAFTTLLLSDLLLCWVSLSHRPFWRRERWTNYSFYWVSAAVLALLFLLVTIPATGDLVHMASLSPAQLLSALGMAAACTLWAELLKVANPKAWRRRDAC